MNLINVYISNAQAETFEDFVDDTRRVSFHSFGGDGPMRLTGGQVWFFVDWIMADLSGLEMCRRLRTDPDTRSDHITMVLEQDDAEDQRRALRAGADDYVTGPISRTAVLDRILAVQEPDLGWQAQDLLEAGPLTISAQAFQARWNGKPLSLAPNEFRLLRFFAENPNRVMSREEIIRGLGKSERAIDERAVDVWMGRLRRAIKAAGGGAPLRTVRLLGYVLDLPLNDE